MDAEHCFALGFILGAPLGAMLWLVSFKLAGVL